MYQPDIKENSEELFEKKVKSFLFARFNNTILDVMSAVSTDYLQWYYPIKNYRTGEIEYNFACQCNEQRTKFEGRLV